MSAEDIISAGGGVAGVAGLALASYTYVGDRLDRKKGLVTVALQRYSRTVMGRAESVTRVAVKNLGPASAERVHVEFLGADPASPSGVVFSDRSQPVIDIPTLHAGESYWVQAFVPVGRDLTHATVSWFDRRLRQQSRSVYLSIADI